ncbi:hypothetical protein [Absidia glauca]|uniref:LIM zinc-binding domain-containing protein n=1 Tax=Absidia glauca TaxID=4829 RepID=A0A168QCI4_ABSGL|nr:hypothetical protein [Absidia glauca]
MNDSSLPVKRVIQSYFVSGGKGGDPEATPPDKAKSKKQKLSTSSNNLNGNAGASVPSTTTTATTATATKPTKTLDSFLKPRSSPTATSQPARLFSIFGPPPLKNAAKRSPSPPRQEEPTFDSPPAQSPSEPTPTAQPIDQVRTQQSPPPTLKSSPVSASTIIKSMNNIRVSDPDSIPAPRKASQWTTPSRSSPRPLTPMKPTTDMDMDYDMDEDLYSTAHQDDYTSDSTTTKSNRRTMLPWPDSTIFMSGHIRQSSSYNEGGGGGSLLPDRSSPSFTSHHLQQLIQLEGKAYLDSLRRKRETKAASSSAPSMEDQQRTTTTSPTMLSNLRISSPSASSPAKRHHHLDSPHLSNYSRRDLEAMMDSLYPSDTSDGWRYPACETLLDRFSSGEWTTKGDVNWCEKYRPAKVDSLLDNQSHHCYLRDWLERHKVAPSKTDPSFFAPRKKVTRRDMEKHYTDDPDDKGDVDDDDDDFMPSVKKKKATTSKKRSKKDLNMVLLVGPHGVGKTASVFTAAQETGYQVFELHPGIKRSLKEVLRLVGDMTKNHLVRFNNQEERGQDDSSDVDMDVDSQPNQLVTQFFTPKSTTPKSITPKSITPKSTTQQKPAMQQSGPKQSLILLEEVDLVYQSDKGFWNAVTDLAQSSKRPIILTCNDVSAIPFDMLQLQAVIYYETPLRSLLLPFLHLICLLEGYDISVHELTAWVNLIGPDIRQLFMTLEYLHYEQRSRPISIGGMARSHTNTLLQHHIDLLMSQAQSHTPQQQQHPWLHISDHIPGAQMTPLCMQLVENDCATPRSASLDDDDDRLLEQLTTWMDNRSIIDSGIGMTDKQISQVYGLDEYGPNDDQTSGYLHCWKKSNDWDHYDMQACMESSLLEMNHPQEGSSLIDIMSWEMMCDQSVLSTTQISPATNSSDLERRTQQSSQRRVRYCHSCQQPCLRTDRSLIRALGQVYHYDCFTCKDCDVLVADKFYALNTSRDTTHFKIVCEQHYYSQVGIVCQQCRQPITTKNSHDSVSPHQLCNQCRYPNKCPGCTPPPVIGEEACYEYGNHVYCLLHFSAIKEIQCCGCHQAVLKQFVEHKSHPGNIWHPECYMIFKFWNVRLADTLQADNPSSERDLTTLRLKKIQAAMERKVNRIWSDLSSFEESSAACISDMLLLVAAGAYVEGFRMASQFVMHLEVLYGALDDIKQQLLPHDKLLPCGNEAKIVCHQVIRFFNLLAQSDDKKPNSTKETSMSVTQELLALVTSLAQNLKTLIRIGLTEVLLLERDHQVSNAIPHFLDNLLELDRKRVWVGGRYWFKEDPIPKLVDPSAATFTNNSTTTLCANQQLEKAWGQCHSCHQSIDDDCFQHANQERWHPACFVCAKCQHPLANDLLSARFTSKSATTSAARVLLCNQCATDIIVTGQSAHQDTTACSFIHLTQLQHYLYLLKLSLSRLYLVMNSSTVKLNERLSIYAQQNYSTKPNLSIITPSVGFLPMAKDHLDNPLPSSKQKQQKPTRRTSLLGSIYLGNIKRVRSIRRDRAPEDPSEARPFSTTSATTVTVAPLKRSLTAAESKSQPPHPISSTNDGPLDTAQPPSPTSSSQPALLATKRASTSTIQRIGSLRKAFSQRGSSNRSNSLLERQQQQRSTEENLSTPVINHQASTVSSSSSSLIINAPTPSSTPAPDPTNLYHQLLPLSPNQYLICQIKAALHLACCMLPKENRDTMQAVFGFLHHVSTFHEVNKMDVYNLARIMAPSVLHDFGTTGHQESPVADRIPNEEIKVVEMLIKHHHEFGSTPAEMASVISDHPMVEWYATMDAKQFVKHYNDVSAHPLRTQPSSVPTLIPHPLFQRRSSIRSQPTSPAPLEPSPSKLLNRRSWMLRKQQV